MLKPGQITIHDDLPIFQNTVFGWVPSGKLSHRKKFPATCLNTLNTTNCSTILTISTEYHPRFCGMTSNLNMESTNAVLEKFWKLEDVDTDEQKTSVADELCEHYFARHTTCQNRRFIVSIPWLDNQLSLGNSQRIAYHRFLSMDRRLTLNSSLSEHYVQFMREYESLGHMKQIREIPSSNFFIPYHYVAKMENNKIAKFRVVFDASCKSSSGVSKCCIRTTCIADQIH